MGKYKKLGVAIIGLILIAADDLLGIELGGDAETVWDGVVSILTAAGVWVTPNSA